MSTILEVDPACPAPTDGEIAAINLESARRRAWRRFTQDPHRSGVAKEVVDKERLAAQFLGDLDALDRALRAAPTALVSVIAAIKSSAEINLSRGATIFNFTPSRSSIGFHVVYSRGNSPFAVMTSSPGFHVSPYATAIAPALAPLFSAISSGLAPINFAIETRMRSGTS
jgi:hypothetical protein